MNAEIVWKRAAWAFCKISRFVQNIIIGISKDIRVSRWWHSFIFGCTVPLKWGLYVWSLLADLCVSTAKVTCHEHHWLHSASVGAFLCACTRMLAVINCGMSRVITASLERGRERRRQAHCSCPASGVSPGMQLNSDPLCSCRVYTGHRGGHSDTHARNFNYENP